jgi:putative salt-induced outer membrane protein YdiY
MRRFLAAFVAVLLAGVLPTPALAGGPPVPPPPPPPGGERVAAPVWRAPACCPPPCDPCAPKGPWIRRVGLALALQDGNSSVFDFVGSAEVEREPDPWGMRVGIQYHYAEQNDIVSADAWHAIARVERDLTKRLYAFGEVLFDADEIANLEYRFTGVAGVGYTIVDDGVNNWKVEAGGGGVYEKYDLLEETFDPSAYAGTRYERKWQCKRIFADLKFLPNLGEWDLTRIVFDSGLEFPLCEWLKLAVGFRVEYVIDPPGNLETTDTFLTVGLKAEF